MKILETKEKDYPLFKTFVHSGWEKIYMVLISIPESIDNRTSEDQNNVGERIRALQSEKATAEGDP